MFKYSRIDNPKIINYLNATLNYSPRSLFNEFFTNLIENTNPQFNKKADSDDYPGYGKMLEYKEQILSTGITEEFKGLDVWPELTSFNSSPYKGVSVKTYAPIVLEKISITSSSQFGIELFFSISSTILEVGMLVELSGLFGLPSEGVPTEWVNGLFQVSFIDFFQGQFFVYLFSLSLVYDYPEKTWVEDKITITPRCFQVKGENLPSLNGISDNASIVKLNGFSTTGGISASIINQTYTIYTITSLNSFFVVLKKGQIANETIENFSSLATISVATFPEQRNNACLYNETSLTRFYTPLTYFFTDKPTLCGPQSQVRLSGFDGEYKHLNGIHDTHKFIHVFYNNQNTIYREEYYPANRKYYTALNVETAGLPTFNPKVHTKNGFYTLERIISPLTDNSSYGQFADSCHYLFKKIGVNTHGRFLCYRDYAEGSRDVSWDSIQHQLSNGINTTFDNRNRNRDPIAGCLKYRGIPAFENLMMNELNKDCYDGIPGNPINVSKRMDPTISGTLILENQMTKYLSSDQIYNVYAFISGQTVNERVPGSDPNNQDISANLIFFGYNANGTTLNYTTKSFISNILLEVNSSVVYYLQNSFSQNNVTLQPLSEDLILANPPLADVPFLNAEDCKGKIVVIVNGNVSFEVKYLNAVNAGAIAIILVNNLPGNIGNVSLGTDIIDNVMIYTLNGVSGNQLTEYNGQGINDPANYTLPTTNSEYQGSIRAPGVSDRLVSVGGNEFRISFIKPEFSAGKKIGYIYLPSNLLLTPQNLEDITVFFDKYNDPESTVINTYSRMWVSVLNSSFEINGKMIKLKDFDSIIIDNSNNIGGYFNINLSLASFFGSDRPSLNSQSSLIGNDFSEPSTTEQIEKSLPSSSLRDNLFVNYPEEVPCQKFQTLYDTKFSGNKVIFLTSNTAFSAGDAAPHYFRNTRASFPDDLGNGVISKIIGTVDGRLQGYIQPINNVNVLTRNSVFSTAPSVTSITAPINAFSLRGESNYWFYNTFTNKTICSQRDEIKVDGLEDNPGPIACWSEDEAGVYQAWGFSTPYLRNNERYKRFNDVIGLPVPYQSATYHQPWLEDAILAASD